MSDSDNRDNKRIMKLLLHIANRWLSSMLKINVTLPLFGVHVFGNMSRVIDVDERREKHVSEGS